MCSSDLSLLKANDLDFMFDFIDWFFETKDSFISQNRSIGILKVSRDKFIAHRSALVDQEESKRKAEIIRQRAEKLT